MTSAPGAQCKVTACFVLGGSHIFLNVSEAVIFDVKRFEQSAVSTERIFSEETGEYCTHLRERRSVDVQRGFGRPFPVT